MEIPLQGILTGALFVCATRAARLVRVVCRVGLLLSCGFIGLALLTLLADTYGLL